MILMRCTLCPPEDQVETVFEIDLMLEHLSVVHGQDLADTWIEKVDLRTGELA